MVNKTFKKSEIIKAFKKQASGKKALEKICHELWREIVYMRAQYKCEYLACRREAAAPHHIFTKGHSRHLRFDPANGMALCYRHHEGSNEAAHSDIYFKDKITGVYPGFKAVRTKDEIDALDRKAAKPYKLDLKMEKLYLEDYLKKLNKYYEKRKLLCVRPT